MPNHWESVPQTDAMVAMVLLDDFLRSIGVVYLTYYWVDAESQVNW